MNAPRWCPPPAPLGLPLLAYASTWILTLGVWAWLGDRNLAQVPSVERRKYHGWQLHFVLQGRVELPRRRPVRLPGPPAVGRRRLGQGQQHGLLPAAPHAGPSRRRAARWPVCARRAGRVRRARRGKRCSRWWKLADHLRGRRRRGLGGAAARLAPARSCSSASPLLPRARAAPWPPRSACSALVKRRWLLAGALAASGRPQRPNMVALRAAACAAAAAIAVTTGNSDWRALPRRRPPRYVADRRCGVPGLGGRQVRRRAVLVQDPGAGWDQHTDWGRQHRQARPGSDPGVRAEPAQNAVYTIFFRSWPWSVSSGSCRRVPARRHGVHPRRAAAVVHGIRAGQQAAVRVDCLPALHRGRSPVARKGVGGCAGRFRGRLRLAGRVVNAALRAGRTVVRCGPVVGGVVRKGWRGGVAHLLDCPSDHRRNQRIDDLSPMRLRRVSMTMV
ncbi:hypothetical protein ACU686_44155 [Yinghuangia aomiensis]